MTALHDRINGILHVVDDTVGHDEQHQILQRMAGFLKYSILLGDLSRFVDHRRENRGPRELHIGNGGLVDGEDPVDAPDLLLLGRRHEAEGVRHRRSRGGPRPEAVHGKHLVSVVWLQHSAHGIDRTLVLVGCTGRTYRVQRNGVQRVAIRAREVDGDHHGDLEAACEVVEEAGDDHEACLCHAKVARVGVVPLLLRFLLLDDGDVEALIVPLAAVQDIMHGQLTVAHVVVLPVLVIVPHLNAKRPVPVSSHLAQRELLRGPPRVQVVLYHLALVHAHPGAVFAEAVHDKVRV
mmetsp:Transcript_15008/g.56927  ORF Transcript_15008/g.56927 Transcript_15008/m.56927 type:complete len:293 (-) Transcript_15008:662-1540(-)